MKTNRSYLLGLLVLGALLALFTIPTSVKADAVTIPATFTTISNATVTATPASYSVDVNSTRDLAIYLTTSAAGTGTSNSTASFDIYDGHVWTTTKPLTATVAQSGTNTVTAYAYFSRTNFYGATAIGLSQWTTAQTNNVTLQSIYAVQVK